MRVFWKLPSTKTWCWQTTDAIPWSCLRCLAVPRRARSLHSAPGWRNEFHAGLQQAFGKYVVFSGEYIWKYTHNAYDFSVLGSTPITFPIEWHNSKIPGFAGRVSVPDFHGFSALMVFSSVAARFFTPQIGGAGAVPSGTVGNAFTAFRIDHDESFNQTTHVQYQPWKRGPWMGFNWRYDSGLVAGEVPVADASGTVDLSGLTGDQQLQAGLFCGSARPTLTTPLGTCTSGIRFNPDQSAQARARRTTTAIRHASLRAISLISRWATTIYSTGNATSGACSLRPSM